MTTFQPDTTHAAGTAFQAQAEGKSLSVASLVLGLVSIVAGWTFLAPIAGLVCGSMALGREPAGRTMAIWGIVLNIVMLAGTLIIGIVIATIGFAFLPFAFL